MIFMPKKTPLALAITLGMLMAGCDSDSPSNSETADECHENSSVNTSKEQCGTQLPPITCPEGELLNSDGDTCIPEEVSQPKPIYLPKSNEAVIYYNRQHIDESYDDWVLHLWNASCSTGWAEQVTSDFTVPTKWPNGPAVNGNQYVAISGVDPIYGAFWVLNIEENAECGDWIIHDTAGGIKTQDLKLDFTGTEEFARTAFVIAGNDLFNDTQVSEGLPICIDEQCQAVAPAPRVIKEASAHWLDAETLVWSLPNGIGDKLYGSLNGEMAIDEGGNIIGGELLAELIPTTLDDAQRANAPHLADWQAFRLEGMNLALAKSAAKGQLWVTGEDKEKTLVGTNVQTARLLDSLYTQGEQDADEASLGPVYEAQAPSLAVWAPTAHNVKVKIFNDDATKTLSETADLTYDTATGIWFFSGEEKHDRQFYRIETTLYDYLNDKVITLETTDPYSVSLSEGGFYSQFVNLDDADTQPDGWGDIDAPALPTPEAAVIYESHVRDFSIRDESTPEAIRGKYLAFTETNTAPIKHLQALKDIGLTHFHVLPTADSTSIKEDLEQRIDLTNTAAELCAMNADAPICSSTQGDETLLSLLESFDPSSTQAHDLIQSIRRIDGFNWGYDPFHYNTPEGSYATDANGITRIKELRAMNQALHGMGLRVVMDVVYNHTYASGLYDAQATFDKIVPGYYLRRDPISGAIVNDSGAGSDTAAEHRMFGKFVIDSVKHWAEHYRYNDFRFDLMTFLPKDVIEDALITVRSVQSDSYFYGEGWDMPGITFGDAMFERAEQINMAGTGIGTFNDRMRDPMRFLALVKGENVDRIRAGLAGNLAAYEMYNTAGELVTADTLGAYTADPQESINYVSKHDNESLWDMIHQEGAIDVDMPLSDRVRIQNLTLAMPLLAQGIPFIHSGSELLRSKSLDRNTYDAGDWYNYVDFTRTTNNWAIGRPIDAGSSTDEWISAAFENNNAKATATDIEFTNNVFSEFLTIAQSSPLFSLETLDHVNTRIGFHNTGAQQVKGIIAMSIDDGIGVEDLDPRYDAVVVVFNGNAEAKSFPIRTANGFSLHPSQVSSVDAALQTASFAEMSVSENQGNEETPIDVVHGIFTVPAYSVAVFVKNQQGEQSIGLDRNASPAKGAIIDATFSEPTFLRGDLNEWSTQTPFLYQGNNQYTAYSTLMAEQTITFKYASADWETVNFGAVDTASANVSADIPVSLGVSETNLTFTPTSSAEYRFNIDGRDAQAPILTITEANAYAQPIYLRGAFNNWAATDELTYINQGIYQAVLTLEPGDYAFKIADSEWAETNIGAGDFGSAIAIDGALQLADFSDSGNITLSIEVAGDYAITLDARIADNPTLNITLAQRYNDDLYIRGSMNAWGESAPLTVISNNVYQGDITLEEGGYEFKIASADWTAVDLTAGRLVTPYQPIDFVAGQSGGNSGIKVEATQTLRFTLDANFANPKLTVTEVTQPAL